MADEQKTVDPQTLKVRRALKDVAQAFQICKKLRDDNQRRNDKAAAMMDKFNDVPPWDPKKLEASGQSWRHNASTGFLSSIQKRVMPGYSQPLNQAPRLTASKLSKRPGLNAEQIHAKSETFQTNITKTIRQWKGWKDFQYQMVFENTFIGYAAAHWMDEVTPWPDACRTDEIFFPEGCPQEAENVPLFCRRKKFLVHQLVDKLDDPEISANAGWQIDSLVKAINAAKGEKIPDATDNRKLMDLARESTLGTSYTEAVKVIETFILHILEPATGKVTQVMMREDNGDPLFVRMDRFESMTQCLSLLSIENGNGKLHGSKGVGRMLYNLSISAEQGRNLVRDNFYLAGLLLLKYTQKGKQGPALQVVHPFAVVGENYDVIDEEIRVNVDAFTTLDEHITRIAENLVGVFMPAAVESGGGEKETASAANYRASIEQQIRQGLLARFWDQFMNIISQMQVRICSTDNIIQAKKIFDNETKSGLPMISRKVAGFFKAIGKAIIGFFIEPDDQPGYDKESVDCVLEMLRAGLTPEEIFELANSPAQEVTLDVTNQNNTAIDMVAARYMGNPRVNQQKLVDKDLTSKLGYAAAQELIIPEEDNTLQVEAIRLQMIELRDLLAGDPIPVSPRDIHTTHMDVVMGKMQDVMNTLASGSTDHTIPLAENVLNHFDSHLQAAAPNAKPGTLTQYEQFSKQSRQMLDQAKAAQGTRPQDGLPANVTPAVVAGGNPGAPSDRGASVQRGGPNEIPAVPTAGTPGNRPLQNGPVNLTPPIGPQPTA